jgi:hypothetical protein
MTIDEVAITQEELDSMSPLGREIAQGLLEALAYVRGEDVEVRITTISIPDPAPVYGASEVKATRAALEDDPSELRAVDEYFAQNRGSLGSGEQKSLGPPARRPTANRV